MLAEVFWCVNYGLSIIISIVHQIIVDFVNININNENINTVSREMIFSKIVSQNLFALFLIHVLSWEIYFRYISDYWEETTN